MTKNKLFLALFLILLISLSGCSKRINTKDALDQGAKRLSYDDIAGLVSGKTLHVVSWDKSMEADVTLIDNGKISAVNTAGEKTEGKWKIDKDSTLCIRYDQWGNRDMKCYAVFSMDDGYKMFQPEGGLESAFTVSGPSRELRSSAMDQQNGSAADSGLRSEIIPEPATNHTVIIPDANAKPSENTDQTKPDSWWKFGWFGSNSEDKNKDTYADYTAPPTPLSREMTHLLDEKECLHCDLTNQNLHKASLKKAELDQADLSGADLSGAFLKGASLKKAILTGAKLAGADLAGADLSGANLEDANLEGANLEDANLEGAVLTKARLVDAILIDAVLRNTDLGQANLHWANLSKADLSGANLKGSYLVKTVFFRADLTGADLTDAVIQRTNFAEVKGYTPTSSGEEKPAEKKEEEKKKSFFGLF